LLVTLSHSTPPLVTECCFNDKKEFAEAQRQVNGSPPVGFSKDAPMELNGVGDLPSVGVGFVSFGNLLMCLRTSFFSFSAMFFI
jgi:hypothetical protein